MQHTILCIFYLIHGISSKAKVSHNKNACDNSTIILIYHPHKNIDSILEDYKILKYYFIFHVPRNSEWQMLFHVFIVIISYYKTYIYTFNLKGKFSVSFYWYQIVFLPSFFFKLYFRTLNSIWGNQFARNYHLQMRYMYNIWNY